MDGHTNSVHSFQSLGNNQLASVTEYAAELKIWNIGKLTNQCARTLSDIFQDESVVCSHFLDKSRLAFSTEGPDNRFYVVNFFSGDVLLKFDYPGGVDSMKSLDNNTLACAGFWGDVKIWNIRSGACLRTFAAHSHSVRALEKLGNNKLASGSGDRTVKIWNIESGECLRTLVGHLETVNTLQSLGNNRLASGSLDKLIRIWNIESGACVRILLGHLGSVSALQLVSSTLLASGSDDTTIKIWNIETAKCIRTLTGHSSPIIALHLLE